MRFALTDDQVALRDAVRELLTASARPTRSGPPGPARRRPRPGRRDLGASWPRWACSAPLVPEADGGLGLGDCDLVPLLEEAGRAALPLPLVETAFVAAPLLAAPATRDELLARLIGGDAVVAASLDGSGLVPFAGVADALLVGDGPGAPIGLSAADAPQPAALDRRRPRPRPRRRRRARRAACDLDAGECAAAWDRGVLGAAAQLVGLGRAHARR